MISLQKSREEATRPPLQIEHEFLGERLNLITRRVSEHCSSLTLDCSSLLAYALTRRVTIGSSLTRRVSIGSFHSLLLALGEQIALFCYVAIRMQIQSR